MRPPHFSMNFENSSYSVTCRNICRNSVTNLSTNRDAQHYEFRTIKILTCQYLVPLVSLNDPLQEFGFVLFPRATFVKEVTEPLRKKKM